MCGCVVRGVIFNGGEVNEGKERIEMGVLGLEWNVKWNDGIIYELRSYVVWSRRSIVVV